MLQPYHVYLAPVVNDATDSSSAGSSGGGGSQEQPEQPGQEAGEEPMVFAGLWDVWDAPEGPMHTYTILTTGASAAVCAAPAEVAEGRHRSLACCGLAVGRACACRCVALCVAGCFLAKHYAAAHVLPRGLRVHPSHCAHTATTLQAWLPHPAGAPIAPAGAPNAALLCYHTFPADASKRLEWLHDRMPVILRTKAAQQAWLSTGDKAATG